MREGCVFCSECELILSEPEASDYFKTDDNRCVVCAKLFPKIHKECMNHGFSEYSLFRDRINVLEYLKKIKKGVL